MSYQDYNEFENWVEEMEGDEQIDKNKNNRD